MGDWKKYFSEEILKEGEALYRRHGVHDHKRVDPMTFTARVYDEGKMNYLSVHKNENGTYDMSCSCEKKTGIRYCKHLAAAMHVFHFADDAVEKPLFDEASHQKYYFNIGRMTKSMKFRDRDIEAAEKAVQESKIIFKDIHFRYENQNKNDSNYLIGTIRCLNQEKNKKIVIEFDDQRIREMQYFGRYWKNTLQEFGYSFGDINWEMVAGLMILDQYIAQYNPGDSTDLHGDFFMRKVLDASVVKKIVENKPESKVITLLPRMIKKGNSLTLTFRIGKDRLYAIKMISKLAEKYQAKEAIRLNKNQEFHFSEETFTDESQPFMEFICEESRKLKAEKQLSPARQELPSRLIEDTEYIGSEIVLSASTLDDFYDFALTRRIEYLDSEHDKYPRSLRVGESSLRVGLDIKTAMRERHPSGITIELDMPEIIYGAKYSYFISHSQLSRIKEEDEKAIEPLLDPFTHATPRVKTLHIGKKHLSEFYYQVLPILEANPVFEINEEYGLADTIPPEAVYHFYLDYEDNQVLCYAEVSYDQEKYRLKKLEEKDFPLADTRDTDREKRAVETIERYMSIYDREKEIWSTERENDNLFSILDTGIKQLMEFGEVNATDAFKRLKIRRIPEFSFGISLSHDLLNLELMTKNISPAELLNILESYREKKKYYRLSNGEFISMNQNDTMDALEQLMNSMNLSVEDFTNGKLEMPAYRALYVNKLLQEHNDVAAERDRYFRNLVRSFNSVKDSDLEIPKEIKNQLRKYQIYGVRWMHTLAEHHFGGILADDMGLGKTIQMIALLDSVKDDMSHPAFIICPASVVYNWEEEFHRFAPSLRVKVLAGTANERHDAINEFGATDVYITSYDLARRDIGLYKDKTFSYQVLDEGQYIKNPKSIAAKTVKIIHSQYRFVLTGTPIENRLSELWSIFDYLMPGFLFTYEEFKERYEYPIAKQKDKDAAESLRKMISPFILRRLKQDVLKELPEKIEEVRFSRFDQKQKELYDGQLVKMKSLIQTSKNDNDNRFKILAELTKLREICCDPSILIEDYDGQSAKTDSCMELLESAIDGGHRVLVFSQFTKMLEILEKHLDNAGLKYFKLTGSTPKAERIRLVHDFNESDSVPVFLISLKAGGTGLNLTGADVVIHYDPWWNLAAENQATDRAHRIGQKNTVAVYKLIIKDSVEEKVMEIQNKKKDLADAVLSGENVSISSLSKEELMELLA